MAENLLNDMNQTSENRRNDMIVTASTTTSDDYKAAKDEFVLIFQDIYYDAFTTRFYKISECVKRTKVDDY